VACATRPCQGPAHLLILPSRGTSFLRVTPSRSFTGPRAGVACVLATRRILTARTQRVDFLTLQMIASLRRVAPARFVRARLGLTTEIAGICVAHGRIGDAANLRVTCVLAGRSEKRGSHSSVPFASQSLTGFPEEGWIDWRSGAKARATAQANVQVEIIIDVVAEAFTHDGGLSGLAERHDPMPKRGAGENNV
jgi:hypothetical protein